jgi:hypothetical protein
MKIRTGFVAATLIAIPVLAASCGRGPTAEQRAWWSHVEYLASDSLEGRNTGSEGYRKAAEYVAGEFEKAGAQPGAGESFLQPVEFISRRIREHESSLELIRNGVAQPIVLGDEATISVSLEPTREIEAPLVFAGYAMSVPEAGYDDLEGLDLQGRIVVYISGGPSSIDAPLRAHAQSSEERWKALHARGARGLLSLSNPNKEDVPWERSVKRRFEARLTMADPALNKTPGLEFSASLNGAKAARWFEGSGHTVEELLDLATREEPLPRFPLVGLLRARVSFDQAPLRSDNVVGIIPGTDPELRNQYVVLSGHLDHLGVGGAVDGDSIYNGAMDNASGIATMIEIAKMAKARGVAPRRSLVLLAVTGEEKGLLGSRHFAAHPTVPSNGIVANVNMDMYLPIVSFEILTVYGRKESDLGDWIGPIAERHGVRVQDDPEPHRRIFIRSDQYNFILEGIPALSFKVGFEKGTPEDSVFANWTKQRYHAPSDDLDQPVDLAAAVKFTAMLHDFCMDLANRDESPRWKEDSFFRRFAVAAGREPVATTVP